MYRVGVGAETISCRCIWGSRRVFGTQLPSKSALPYTKRESLTCAKHRFLLHSTCEDIRATCSGFLGSMEVVSWHAWQV